MALNSYSALQSAIESWLLRTDLSAGASADFITLAEAQITRDIRHWRMVTTASLTIDAQYVALPSDWVETTRISTNASGYAPLRLSSVADIEAMRGSNSDTTGTPSYYAHIGGNFEFYPTPDTTYTGELIYTAKIPALSDANTTNWLLDEAPDAYLYGSLIQSAPYLVEDARIAVWGSLYAAGVKRLNDTSDAAKWSGTGLKFGTRRTS